MASCTEEATATAFAPHPGAAHSGSVRAPGVEAARDDGGGDPVEAAAISLLQADRGDGFVKPKRLRPTPMPGDAVVRLASRLDRARALLASILRASGLEIGEGPRAQCVILPFWSELFIYFSL